MTTFDHKRLSLRKRLSIRAILDALLVFLILFGPWWLSVTYAGLCIMFLRYYEMLLGGLLLDSMYAGGAGRFDVGEYLNTSILLVSITLSFVVTPRVRGMN